MTIEQYNQALEGLRAAPSKHYEIDGRVPTDEDQLNRYAKLAGLQIETTDQTETVAEAPVILSISDEKSDASEQKQDIGNAPEEPSDKEEKPVEGDETADENETSPSGNTPDLGTMTYKQLQVYATEIGVNPVPKALGDLQAAIKAKLSG